MATKFDQEVVTQQEIEQEVHADIYGVSKEDLEKKQKEAAKADDGGSICTQGLPHRPDGEGVT